MSWLSEEDSCVRRFGGDKWEKKHQKGSTYKSRFKLIILASDLTPPLLQCLNEVRSNEYCSPTGKAYSILWNTSFHDFFLFRSLATSSLSLVFFDRAFQVVSKYDASLWLAIRFAVWRLRAALVSCNTIRSLATTSGSGELQYDSQCGDYD